MSTEVDIKIETISKEGDIKIETIPQDARFHNCNCTNWCYESFLEYQRCIRLLGEECPACEKISKAFLTICPHAWVKRWEEQIEEGTFPRRLPPKENDCTNLYRTMPRNQTH